MTVRIGINPLTWTNDDLAWLGGETPLETCLAEGREAGYAGFELGHKFPQEPKALKNVLSPHGLDLVSGWYSGGLLERTAGEEIKALQGHLHLLKEAGADVFIFAEVTHCVHGDRSRPLSQRPRLTEAQWAQFAERLDQVAAYLRTQGLQLVYHHHMGTVVETEADVDQLMERTGDAVGLLLDTGHLVFAGGDPLAVARRHAARVHHVHCKDVRSRILDDMRNRDASFLDCVLAGAFTVPGDGTIDYHPIFEVLKANGYRGWLVVEAEQDPAIAPSLEYATKGFQYLDTAVARLGWH